VMGQSVRLIWRLLFKIHRLRRFGLPEEVACVAGMLASDESGYLTGTEINIDGGILEGSAGVPAK
ncbi:SDR family oxidoreductase, partial [Vibrio cholerae]